MKTCHSDARQGGADHSSRVSGIFTLHPLAWALACLIAPGWALAELPTGFNPVSGSVTQNLATPGAMTLQQNSERAIVNWNSFSIGGQNRVDISQPGVSSMLLNRVTGGLPSEIAGSLTANGRVFLVNPSGVVFGAGSRVSTGGLVASTLDISNDDFNAGRLNFSRADGNQAAVINRGNLQAGPGGTIALLGAVVRNEGSIKADGGTAALVSARQLSLDFQGDGLTTFRIDPNNPASQALVQNAATGVVQADGGRVAILADAGSAAQLVVNQQGVLRARSLVQREGEIILGVGSDDRAEIGGVLDASGDVGLRGGKVNITGGGLYLNDQAIVDVGGATGGGRVDVQATQSVTLAKGAKLNADARVDGKGGTLNLQGGPSLRAYGTMQARGAGSGAGGFIETSARSVDLAGLTVQATGAPGQLAGTWVIDPFNITVSHGTGDEDVCCVLGSPFDPVTADSTIFDGVINASLDGGSNVRIHTGPATASDVGGRITIEDGVYIRRSAGSNPLELRFDANEDIIGRNFFIISEAGPLDVAFNANANGFRPTVGDIDFSFVSDGLNDVDVDDDGVVDTRSVIRTNGGNVTFLGGGAGPVSTSPLGDIPAIILSDLQIDTSSGNGSVVMGGHTAGDTVVNLFGVDIRTSTGGIAIQGQRPEANAIGVIVNNSSLESDTGTIALLGSSFVDSGVRIENDSRIFSSAGNVSIFGSTNQGLSGLAVVDSEVGSVAGNVALAGISVSTLGVQLSGSNLNISSGDISVSGRSNESTGVEVSDSIISGESGRFALSGVSVAATGVDWSETDLNVLSGDVIVVGRSSGSQGVLLTDSDFISNNGSVTISGHSDDSVGVQTSGGRFESVGGNIAISGSSVNSTALLSSGTDVVSDIGNVSLFGSSSHEVGVSLEDDSLVSTASGAVLLQGFTPDGVMGVSILDSTIETQSGIITLLGQAGEVGDELADRVALQIVGSSITTDQGSIDVRGRVAASSAGAAVIFDSSSLDSVVSSQRGNVSLAGEAVGNTNAMGLQINATAISAGNLLQLRAATDNPDQIALAIDDSTLGGTVAVNFRPGGVTSDGELTDHVSTPIQLGGGFDGDKPVSNFRISQDIIDQVTTPLLILGSDIQTGSIVVASDISIGDGTQLTLQAEGSGGSIDVRAPLNMADGTLALLADDPVSQNETGIITTGQLVASSRNASVLLNLSNDIGRFAGSAATELRVTDRTDDLLLDDLAFGAMSGDASIQRQLAGTRAGTNTVLTVGEGDLLQSSTANVVTDGLLAISTRGSVQLNNAGNASRVVAGQSAQTFSYTNGTGLTLGNVAGVAGVRANQVELRASSGDVTQIAGADINSESLLVESAAGNVLLNNPGNAPHVLAGRAAQAFSFTNLDNLNIGTVDGVSGVQAGSVFIRNLEGDLTLDQPVTATAGSAVLVTGGRLQNPTGQTISASSFWQIWANTWIGENRGALVGSGSLPNLYGCAFGGACASAVGLAATTGDNHFIYLQQPTAQITIGSGAGPFGFTPRFRTSISGLVLGDTGNGINGSTDSEFSQIARPGTFSVGGTFTSAEGYLLTVSPGVWTNYLTTAVEARPDWTRERPDTWLYDHNMGGAAMCAAPGVTMANAVQEGDVLSREWSLVKSRPKLSSCVASDKQNGCSDF